MSDSRFSHVIVVLQALLVTFLWSTSFILIKLGLAELPPITFAGLRYMLAFLCFIPFLLKKNYLDEIRRLTSKQWRALFLLGVVFYTFTQGAQFLGLSLLPAVSVSLMLNFTPLVVAIMAIPLLNEKPSVLQWTGALVFIIGVFFYFFPISISGDQGLGLLVMSIGVMANALASILGRKVNRNKDISPIVVTSISMGVGAIILLIIGLSTTGIPDVSPRSWLFLFILAVVNTAFAFTLWNHTLRSLAAIESSIINSTMLMQIAILAWVFIDEKITPQEGIGMVIATIGAALVQIKLNKQKSLKRNRSNN